MRLPQLVKEVINLGYQVEPSIVSLYRTSKLPSFYNLHTRTTGLAHGLFDVWITSLSCISLGLRAISFLTAKGIGLACCRLGTASPISMCTVP